MNLPQRARIAADLSQRAFARLLGTSQGVISRWEAGEATPSAPIRKLLELIAEHPDYVPDWLTELGVDATSTKV